MELYKLTAHEAVQMMNNREFSSKELTQSVLARISAVEDKVGAYISVTEDEALAVAQSADEKIARGEKLAGIEGVPIAIKDNMCTKNMLTTCASKMLSNFVPPYDATAVLKVKKGGGVIVGKANMDEFAMGSTTEHSYFKKTANPYDTTRVPGGSSGGSAAAVAADEAILALGSDTGGSIRQPAALCGVVGMKPTYGLVSRYGLVAFASSLDQIGPVAKDVRDCAQLLNTIVGHDDKDSTSLLYPERDYTGALTGDIRGLKLGLPKEYFGEGVDKAVSEAVKRAAAKYEQLGACVEECSLEKTQYALAAYYIISSAEASSNLARYDGIKYGYRAERFDNLIDLYTKTRSEGFGDEVKRRIMIGTYALSSGYYDAYYKKALEVRTLVKRDFDAAFEKYDALLTPVSPTAAWQIGSMEQDPMRMYMADVCTVSLNIAGLPGIALPCGQDADKMPIGMQLIGKAFGEETILRAAYAFEQETDFCKMRPAL
ncbi:MAG: Asp-tRNA(Asn)/Glu-tRNA(Gln) amidotransferase subunit GatA [Clostridia bacterium]|nr:Asp-tRNA(Asn)/Glu-tRNA(Gln) amidotransferase subunit GatA [Clostridia bacterium]